MFERNQGQAPADARFVVRRAGVPLDLLVAVALGQDGAIYAGGTTNSTDLNTTAGAFQTTAGLRGCATFRFFVPCTDGFVAKLSNDETQLQYLTYLREADTTPPQSDVFDSISSMAVDTAGNAYVTGSTTSAS